MLLFIDQIKFSKYFMKNIIWSTGHMLRYNDIVDADNCYVYDRSGRRWVDLESGVWCTSLGHNNKRINAVITEQIGRISHTGFCYCHPAVAETAEKILSITNMPEGACEFLSSGSEAVEYGMRIARALSRRPLALSLADAYFGTYGDAALRDSRNWFVYDRLSCQCNENGNGCSGDCSRFEEIPFENIGIFILEPGSSMGLVRFPEQSLVEKIAGIVQANGGIVISNEVTTGIGRTGKWFGYQHYNIQPDIIAMGKGLGNGYPVSAVAVSERIMKELASGSFHYSQSHQNDPLGAVVAREVIDIIQESDLTWGAAFKGEYLMSCLAGLMREMPLISDVRGRGLMLAIEFRHSTDIINIELLKRGFITGRRPNSEVLRLDPALTIEKATIDLFVTTLRDILSGTGGEASPQDIMHERTDKMQA